VVEAVSVLLVMPTLQTSPVVLVVLAQRVLFGPARHDHSHQPIQGICNA
jgi:hypothetical protein